MNKLELNEIKRRLNPETNGQIIIRGCYCGSRGDIISTFVKDVARMPVTEAERYLALFRRVMLLTDTKNGMDIAFDHTRETDPERELLMKLCTGRLRDEEDFGSFCEGIRGSYKPDTNYLILMMNDIYDVPTFAKDGTDSFMSSSVFNYVICCVCPVKPMRGALSYSSAEQAFINREGDMLVAAPEFGFMYPTFDDRMSNIYSAAYCTRDLDDPHEEIIAAIFNADKPLTAPETKMALNNILEDSLRNDYDYDVVQSVNTQLIELINEQKKDKSAAPLTVNKRDMAYMLENVGVEADKIDAFEEAYDEEFGAVAELSARSIVSAGSFEVRTPDVVIRTKPDKSDLIETRVIDGQKYILIRADDGVEVNGMNIKIN